jgi:hypothetical protein
MDMVHQHDHRPAGHQPGEEGHAVLYVDHEVGPLAQHRQQCPQVDRVHAAAPDVAHAGDDTVVAGVRVPGTHDRHPVAQLHQAGGDALDVAFRAAAVRVEAVAPVGEQDRRWARAHRARPAGAAR